MKQYLEWSKRKPRTSQMVLTLVLAGFLFVLLLPYAIVRLGPQIDGQLGLAMPGADLVRQAAGLLLLVCGGAFAVWSVGAEIIRGEGTPVPAVPTRWLVASGPFRYCRNPMTLGTILAYSGIAIWAGTLSGLVFALLFGAALLVYLKTVEEKELAARFGEDYLAYKRKTPFLIPRLPRSQG